MYYCRSSGEFSPFGPTTSAVLSRSGHLGYAWLPLRPVAGTKGPTRLPDNARRHAASIAPR